MKIRVGIVGVSGYAGLELVRLALEHPEMELAAAMDAREVGEKPVREIHPRLKNICDLITFPPGENRLESLDLDTVFLCTPDKVSIELAPMFLSLDIRVIDLSGGFRIKDESVFSSSYGYQHTNSELLKTAALFRCINPGATIRFAGGRPLFDIRTQMESLTNAFDGIMVGNYLTKKGLDIEADIANLENNGFRILR